MGFIYDLTQIVMCKTARRESWVNVFVRNGHETEDLHDLEQVLRRFDDVDPSLLLFGYRDRKKGSLIGNIFGEFANENMPKCDFIAWDKPVAGRVCPKCGSVLLQKSGKIKKIFCSKEGCGYEEKLSKEKKA